MISGGVFRKAGKKRMEFASFCGSTITLRILISEFINKYIKSEQLTILIDIN